MCVMRSRAVSASDRWGERERPDGFAGPVFVSANSTRCSSAPRGYGLVLLSPVKPTLQNVTRQALFSLLLLLYSVECRLYTGCSVE